MKHEQLHLPDAADTRGYVLSYVKGRPGASVEDVIRDRPEGVSRKQAEQAIKDLLYGVPTGERKPVRVVPDPSLRRTGRRAAGGAPVRGPALLRSEHPAGTHAFGRGQARLWLAES